VTQHCFLQNVTTALSWHTANCLHSTLNQYTLWSNKNVTMPPPPVGAGGGYVFGSSAVRASVRDSRGSFMFPRYLQYLFTDFRQTFVTSASRDRDDLITFLGQKVKVQGHAIPAEAHSTRRYRWVQLFLVIIAITLSTINQLLPFLEDLHYRKFATGRSHDTWQNCSVLSGTTKRYAQNEEMISLRHFLKQATCLTAIIGGRSAWQQTVPGRVSASTGLSRLTESVEHGRTYGRNKQI